MELIDTLQRLDRVLFGVFYTRSNRHRLRSLARTLSRSANGYLHALIPVVLMISGAPQASALLGLLALSLLIERPLYWCSKNSFKRLRPADANPSIKSVIHAGDQFSFPSGHTSGAFLLATSLVLVYGPLLGVMYLWSVMIAVSRVVLGVHYPGDTLAGALMGVGVVLMAAMLLGG